MKLGILGTGKIVQDLMSTYDQLPIEKTYILGTPRHEDHVRTLVDTYHLDGYFLDYDELLKADIDTVYVALPNHLHYQFAKKALDHGKHVILEKPATSNVWELEELIVIAKLKGLTLLEAVNIHYLPAFHSLKESIMKIGDIRIISFNYSQYSSRYDAFKQGEILPAFDPHKSGGALMDINLYNVNAVLGLCGMPEQIHYQANIERGIDTSGILMLCYPQYQAVCIGAKDCKAPTVSVIQGELGSIRIDTPINQLKRYTINYNDGRTETFSFDDGHHRMYDEFMAFIQIIDHKLENSATFFPAQSLMVSVVMEHARRQAGIHFDSDR